MRILLLILVCISGNLFSQDSTFCRVTQFIDEDSANAKEELTIVYNSRGRKISETYGRFEETCLSYCIGYTVRYVYNDTLLVEKTESYRHERPCRYVYTHDEKGRVKTESKFVWIADQAATPGPLTAAGQTNAVNGKWNQVGLATISYDLKGRKISWDATRLWDANMNMEKWEYDDLNRVTSHQVYGHGKLLRKTDYTYYEGGYRFWVIRYGQEGELLHENEQGQNYQSMIVHVVKLDKNGRKYSETLSGETGVQQCSMYFYYDKDGKLIRSRTYDSLGTGITTHVYNYQK
jgi:hypothetical protein